MAFINTTRINGKTIIEIVLLQDIISINHGEWFKLAGLASVSVHIEGIINATLQLCGSNRPVQPPNTNHGVQLGHDITVDEIIYYDVPLKWIKMRVSNYISGSISAYLIGE